MYSEVLRAACNLGDSLQVRCLAKVCTSYESMSKQCQKYPLLFLFNFHGNKQRLRWAKTPRQPNDKVNNDE